MDIVYIRNGDYCLKWLSTLLVVFPSGLDTTLDGEMCKSDSEIPQKIGVAALPA